MNFKRVLFLVLLPGCIFAQETKDYTFKIVPLGVKGGSDESNLSAYMIAPIGSHDFISLDAGTINYGIKKATDLGVFKPSDQVLKDRLKAYLISHAHLDHVSGLIINSPEDSKKNIYAFPEVITNIRDSYFTWKGWANFANEGDKPFLNKYQYVPLKEQESMHIEQTDLSVKAFKLSHVEPYMSTAFLIEHANSAILYFGDTGSDQIEKTDRLEKIWKMAGPLISSKQLKAIFIEVSFPDEQADNELFGHLTPKLLMIEFDKLSKFAIQGALKNFPVIICHIKPIGKNQIVIKQQLKRRNLLGLKLIFPEQGRLLKF